MAGKGKSIEDLAQAKGVAGQILSLREQLETLASARATQRV